MYNLKYRMHYISINSFISDFFKMKNTFTLIMFEF